MQHREYEGIAFTASTTFSGLFDPTKCYTYDSFKSLGQRASFTGSVAGDTWTWSAERTAGGTRLLMRMVQHFTADGTMTWKIETSTDGTPASSSTVYRL